MTADARRRTTERTSDGEKDLGRPEDGRRASGPPALPPWDEMAVVGRVVRVHGLRGQVVVNPQTDFVDERFAPGCDVFVERSGAVDPLRIASARVHRGRPIVAFDGIDSIDAAEALAGAELRVPDAWLHPLPAGTHYVHDLVGCRVEAAGEPIGTVEDVEGDGGASRLVVATAGGAVLVPLAADICRSIDTARKVIAIDPPDGLLEVNRPTGLPPRKQRRALNRARRDRRA